MNASIGPQRPPQSDLLIVRSWTEILELLPDAVFIVAGADGGTIRYVNSQAGRMFGYERRELIDQSIDLLVPTALKLRHGQLRSDYARAPTRRPMGASLNLRGRRRDGTEFPVEISLSPVGSAESPQVICAIRDVTDRRKLEDRVAERTRELESAKNESARANEVKSRFLAAASHDLRQPLQTIWSLQAVLARALKDSELTPHLNLLEEAVRNMDQMLSSLIDINRLEKGAIQPVIRDFPLQEILPRLRSEFGYAARAKSLALDIEDSAEFARSDSMLLPVILRNLIGNAIKYTQHGMVQLRVRSEATKLFIDIIDSGPGIAPEHLQRLFDAFYQIDNPSHDQRQGIGLGLSIVETICRLLGHEVTIQSRLGEGSTFTVQIQRGATIDSPPEPAPITTMIANIPSSGAKILHIEDDPGIARSMALLLGLEGYCVVGAASRDEALEHIKSQGFRPDLILSDYQLPMGYTGVEIVAEIAALLGFKPPTIMLTGDIADRHIGNAKMIADRTLSKPVDVNRLLREMETLLGKPD